MDIDQVASTDAAAQQPQNGALEQPTTQPVPDLENDWNDRFARLSLRERQLLNERKQMQEKLKRLERLEALKDDPDALLGEFGHSYDSLTSRRLEQPKTVEQQLIDELKKELGELKGWRDQTKAEREREEQSRQMQQLMAAVDEILTQDESLEWTRHLGEQQLVIDTAAQYYQATGKKVGLAEAAKWVEDFLEQKYDGLKTTKKWSTKYGQNGQPAPSSAAQDAVHAAAQSADRKGETPSLSSSLAASPTPHASGPESEEVLRQRAIRMLSDGWKG